MAETSAVPARAPRSFVPMTRGALAVLVVLLLLVPVAFWPFYLSKSFATIDRYTHLHAVTGTLWLLLLIAQVTAVELRRYAWHRLLGRTSYVIAPLFVIAASLLSHYRLVSMSDARFAAEGSGHFLPFYAAVVFAAAYVFALVFVREAAAHGRFMLLTLIPMIDPVVGRLMFFHLPPLPSPWLYQAVTFTIATILAALLVFSYRRRGTAQRALYVWFALLVALELGWFFVAPTPMWLDLVRWYRSLPLTGG